MARTANKKRCSSGRLGCPGVVRLSPLSTPHWYSGPSPMTSWPTGFGRLPASGRSDRSEHTELRRKDGATVDGDNICFVIISICRFLLQIQSIVIVHSLIIYLLPPAEVHWRNCCRRRRRLPRRNCTRHRIPGLGWCRRCWWCHSKGRLRPEIGHSRNTSQHHRWNSRTGRQSCSHTQHPPLDWRAHRELGGDTSDTRNVTLKHSYDLKRD